MFAAASLIDKKLIFKGINHQKKNVFSLFTYPRVILNLCDIHSSAEHKTKLVTKQHSILLNSTVCT